VPESTPVHTIRGATSVLRDLLTLGGGRGAAAVLSLITSIFTTRLLGPAGYGTVALVGVVAMLIFTASSAWTGVSVRRYGREELHTVGSMSSLTWNRLLIALPLSMLAAAVLVGLKLLQVLPGDFTWELIGIALATGLVNVLVDHWACLLETNAQMKVSAYGQVMAQAIYVCALVIVAASVAHLAPSTVLLLAVGSASCFALGAIPFVWREGLAPVRVDRRLLKRMLWLSAPMIALLVSQYVFASVDLVTLRAFRTQSAVGVYAVAYQAYGVLATAAIALTSVLLPLFVSLQTAGHRSLVVDYLERHVAQGVLVLASIAGIVVGPASALVPVVFGSRFAGATHPLIVLGIGLMFLYATYLVAPVITLHEQTRAAAAMNIIATIINVVLDLLLVGLLHIGVIGPAIGTTMATVYLFIAFYLSARRHCETRSFPHPLLVTPLFAGALPPLLLRGALGIVLGSALALVTAVAVLRTRSPFTEDDVEVLTKLAMPAPVRRLCRGVILFGL
jgi:PST family polysaccharide transporter